MKGRILLGAGEAARPSARHPQLRLANVVADGEVAQVMRGLSAEADLVVVGTDRGPDSHGKGFGSASFQTSINPGLAVHELLDLDHGPADALRKAPPVPGCWSLAAAARADSGSLQACPWCIIQRAPPCERCRHGKPAARDRGGDYPHENVLPASLPRKQQEPHGVQDFLGQLYAGGFAFHRHAPSDARILVYPVGFQRHGRLSQGCVKFGALPGAEDQRSMVNLVVDREDVGMVGDPDRQPSHGHAPQEAPALLGGQDFDLRNG